LHCIALNCIALHYRIEAYRMNFIQNAPSKLREDYDLKKRNLTF
jgi:hypothetical protein